jgi:hypothetical protein
MVVVVVVAFTFLQGSQHAPWNILHFQNSQFLQEVQLVVARLAAAHVLHSCGSLQQHWVEEEW